MVLNTFAWNDWFKLSSYFRSKTLLLLTHIYSEALQSSEFSDRKRTKWEVCEHRESEFQKKKKFSLKIETIQCLLTSHLILFILEALIAIFFQYTDFSSPRCSASKILVF